MKNKKLSIKRGVSYNNTFLALDENTRKKIIQMCDDDTGKNSIVIARCRDAREIRISTMIEIAHMHAAIKHNSLSIDCDDHTTLPNFLPSA